MKALIVDDTKMTLFVAEKTLRSLGVSDVVSAEDGAIALTRFKESPADIIFSDWNMPNMNGLELLIEIRKISKTVPFVMITTEGCRGKITEAVQHGVNDYLVKPFTPAQLKAKMEKWVGATT
ncbi:MAG: response regulator [Planctomycetaceae bacterium]|nr:response regulator [Planctomycetaceae bacterium]